MPIVLNILKAIAVRLATKYAAELLMKHLISALEKAAKDTETALDDDVVAKVKAEQDFIVSVINAGGK